MIEDMKQFILHTARMKRIICKDGVSLSVQANSSAYSTPRDFSGYYTHAEVGFIQDANGYPFTPPAHWQEWSDGSFPSDVYGYVPVDEIEKFIAEHGGRKFYSTINS